MSDESKIREYVCIKPMYLFTVAIHLMDSDDFISKSIAKQLINSLTPAEIEEFKIEFELTTELIEIDELFNLNDEDE